ncbi:MAG: GxxExxY protein [Verrucomicrobiota bacterium]
MKDDLIHKQECYDIIGACFEVYNEVGNGFTENVFQECLEMEFSDRGIPFRSQTELPLFYKGRQLNSKFRPDFLCYEKIVVELKAVSGIADEHRAQVLNYLNAGRFELGLIVNFGHHPGLEYERLVESKNIRVNSRDSRAGILEEIEL